MTEVCLLGNIAVRSQKKLKWDGTNFRFTNDQAANKALHREYRQGWTLELHSVKANVRIRSTPQAPVHLQFDAILLAAVAVLLLASSRASGQDGRILYEGWTIVADPEVPALLIVDHARLGRLLTNVQLNIPTGQGLVPAKGWTVTNDRQGLLQIKTVQPQSTWLLEMGLLALKISCTAPEAVLTAQVPVGKQRTMPGCSTEKDSPLSGRELTKSPTATAEP